MSKLKILIEDLETAYNQIEKSDDVGYKGENIWNKELYTINRAIKLLKKLEVKMSEQMPDLVEEAVEEAEEEAEESDDFEEESED